MTPNLTQPYVFGSWPVPPVAAELSLPNQAPLPSRPGAKYVAQGISGTLNATGCVCWNGVGGPYVVGGP